MEIEKEIVSLGGIEKKAEEGAKESQKSLCPLGPLQINKFGFPLSQPLPSFSTGKIEVYRWGNKDKDVPF